MSVRADWGVSALKEAPQDFDPFAVPSSTGMKPVDLSTPEPELREHLAELLRREANLFDCGTTCALKELPDATCSNCPVSQAKRTEGAVDEMRLASLCRLGVEQERVLMLLLAQRHGD